MTIPESNAPTATMQSAPPDGAAPGEPAREPAAMNPGSDPMGALDFLLGEITGVFNNGTKIEGSVQKILGGKFYQMKLRSWNTEGQSIVGEGLWTIGWSEPDHAYLSYYIDNTGMQGHSSSPGWEDGVLKFIGTHVLIGGEVRTATRDEFQVLGEDHFIVNGYYQDQNGDWKFGDRQDCHRTAEGRDE